MELPSVQRSMLGLALLAIGVSGYVWPMLQQVTAAKPVVAKVVEPRRTYRIYQDRRVALELPSGWRWLAQKPDGSEDGASYFALSRFQGQNVLNEPVSVRVDALNNLKRLDAPGLLTLLQGGVAGGAQGAVRPIAGLPAGTAGMAFASKAMGRPVLNFQYVRPAGTLAYVLSVGSFDQRFTEALANRIFARLQIES